MKRGAMGKLFRQVRGSETIQYFKHQNRFLTFLLMFLTSSSLIHKEHQILLPSSFTQLISRNESFGVKFSF